MKDHRSTAHGRGLSLLLGLAALTAVTRAEAQAPDPDRTRFDLGGYELSLRCVGSGSPTVVFDGGAGTWSVHYRHLQDALEPTTRVCTYDRAGFGASDPSPLPRTSEHMASELHDLLEGAGEAAPFVLVGHSLGGYNVRVFTDRYPDLVAALVLMDSGHEDQFDRLPVEVGAAIAQAGPQFSAMAEMARAGQLPDQPLPPAPAFEAHPQLEAEYAHAVKQPGLYEASSGEMLGARKSAEQAGRTRPLGELPLVVVTAGNSFAPYGALGIPVEAANAVWMDLQAEFLDLSTNAVQLIAPESSHQIDWEAPDLVVDAVERAVRAARHGTRVDAGTGSGGDRE